MSWADVCYRNLFFDFHNHELVEGVAAEFDAAEWAKILKRTGVQCVNVFTNDMFGWKYYRKGEKGYIHPRLPEGLDMIEDTVRECHRLDICVIAYYAPQRPDFIRQAHPEWMRKTSDGKLPDKAQNGLCRLSPVTDEELLPQVEEIMRLYDLDGIYFDGTYAFGSCYCDSCKKKYHDDTGHIIPTDQSTLEYKRYLKWLLDKHTEFKRNMIDAVHRGNPKAMVMDNWAYTYRLSEIMPPQIDVLKCDIEPHNQVFHSSMTARSFALTGKPFFIQNTGFLKWWGEWGIKPAATLMQESAAILANGGKIFTGYQMHPRFKVEEAVMDTFRQVFDFVAARESIVKGSIIEPYIGVFHSTVNRGVTHESSIWPELLSVYGIHKLLTDAGLHYNLLSDQNIVEDIKKFKAAIIPDMRYMKPETALAIREYVQNGGKVIVTGLTGTLSEGFEASGGMMLEDVLGVGYKGLHPDSHAYLVSNDEALMRGALDMPHLVEAQFAYVDAVSAKPLARLVGPYKRSDGQYILRYSPAGDDTGYPAITINNYGEGKAVFISGDIFRAYYTGAQWNLVPILRNLLFHYLGVEQSVEVIGPETIEVSLARKESRMQIHLVNTTGVMPAFGTPDISCITRSPISIHDFSVRVLYKKDPHEVRLLPENEALQWIREGDFIRIRVPMLGIHSCIEIEP